MDVDKIDALRRSMAELGFRSNFVTDICTVEALMNAWWADRTRTSLLTRAEGMTKGCLPPMADWVSTHAYNNDVFRYG